MSSFRKTTVAVVLALSIGAQWPLLQSFAWLNMLLTFSATEGLQQAIVKTFDGKHLCKVCKFVREGKEAEKESPAKEKVKKLDPMVAGAGEFHFQILNYPLYAPLQVACAPRAYAPLHEPPDLA